MLTVAGGILLAFLVLAWLGRDRAFTREDFERQAREHRDALASVEAWRERQSRN